MKRYIGIVLFACLLLCSGASLSEVNKWPPKITSIRCLTPNGGLMPAFFPDGKRIVFVRTTAEGEQQLWTTDVKTVKPRRIGLLNDVEHPVISPDGRWIAYMSGPVFARQIWIVDPEGLKPRQLTEVPAVRSAPCWTSSGKRLTFAQGRDKERRIVSIDPFAEKPSKTILSRLGTGQPTFSPSGKFIAINELDKNGAFGLRVLRANGSLLTAIAPVPQTSTIPVRGCYQPAFSPNERYLVYVRAGIQPLADLYLHDLRSGKKLRLTTDQADNQTPVFSPDGKAIAFVSFRGNNAYKVWLMSLENINFAKESSKSALKKSKSRPVRPPFGKTQK